MTGQSRFDLPVWFAGKLGTRVYYGWVVVAVAICANLAVFSFNPMFGLFITPLEQTFGWNRATIARSLTLATLAGAVMAPMLGHLIDRVGTRALQVLVGLFAGACFALVGQVQAVWQFYLLIALVYPLTWLGVGQMINSVNVSRWFVRRRGRAMGIVMMGASGGAVVFIPVCTLLIESLGWRSTIALYGAIAALLISLPAFLLLLGRPELAGLDAHPELHAASATRDRAAAATLETWTLREAARTRAFWMTLLGLMLGTIAVQGYFVHAIPHMESRGFSRLLASSVWSTFFLVGVLAKFVWGFWIERIGVRIALMLLFLGEALALYLLWSATSPFWLFFFAVVSALGHGPFLQLQAMVWADYYGRAALGRIFGVVQPAIVVSGSLGPWIAGYLYDVTGSYTRFFQLGIGLCLAAVAVFAMTPPPGQRAAHIRAPEPA